MSERYKSLVQRGVLLICAVVFVLAAAYSLYFHCTLPVAPYDDAYITFRYVENLYAGKGLVYNASERVFGSTTPLYVLWLIIVRGIVPGVPLPELAVRGNALFHIAAAGLAAALVARLLGRRAPGLLLGALMALHPEMLYISANGMESFLFLALMLGCFLALAHGRLRPAGALAGLSLVTRPEGAFLLAVWGLAWLAWAKPRTWRGLDWPALAAALAAPALWIIPATIYYGSPIPHSIIAKLQPVYLIPPGWAGATIAGRIAEWAAAPLLGKLPQGTAGLLASLLLLGGALGLVATRQARRNAGWALPAFFGLLLAFYWITNPFLFRWYWPFFWSLTFLLLAAGVPVWGAGLMAHRRLAVRALGAVPLGAMLLLLAYQPLVDNGFLRTTLAGERLTYVEGDRARLPVYREAADWLNARTTPETTVGAPEIGAFGYYYHGYIYDACGLVSPQALPYLPAPASERNSGWDGVIGTAFARAVQPDYVVSMTTFSRRSIDIDPWFQAHYALVKSLPLPYEIWGAREVLIYARRGEGATGMAGRSGGVAQSHQGLTEEGSQFPVEGQASGIDAGAPGVGLEHLLHLDQGLTGLLAIGKSAAAHARQ